MRSSPPPACPSKLCLTGRGRCRHIQRPCRHPAACTWCGALDSQRASWKKHIRAGGLARRCGARVMRARLPLAHGPALNWPCRRRCRHIQRPCRHPAACTWCGALDYQRVSWKKHIRAGGLARRCGARVMHARLAPALPPLAPCCHTVGAHGRACRHFAALHDFRMYASGVATCDACVAPVGPPAGHPAFIGAGCMQRDAPDEVQPRGCSLAGALKALLLLPQPTTRSAVRTRARNSNCEGHASSGQGRDAQAAQGILPSSQGRVPEVVRRLGAWWAGRP
jgi:hypothetical protein